MGGHAGLSSSLRLAGRRIVLRILKPSDWRDFRKVVTEPRTMLHLKNMHAWARAASPAALKKKISGHLAALKREEALIFAVILRKTGELVGFGGFRTLNLDNRAAEFGLALLPSTWGLGIGAEVHLLALDHGFKRLKLHRVEFLTSEFNAPMRRFFAKTGIGLESIRKEAGFENGRYINHCLYAVFAKGWPSIRKKLDRSICARLCA